jgi:hypothetical protein
MRKFVESALLALLILTVSLPSFATDGDDKDKPGDDKNKPASTKDTKGAKKTMAQPDGPGALVIEIASNILQNAPDQMGIEFIGSWTVNLYYMYDFPIGNSNFSLDLGVGVGLEKYSFSNDITLVTNADDTQTLIETLDNVIPTASKYRKSNFANNYIDFPLEVRYYANKENRRKSFKAAIGGKFGIRYDVLTKVKYEENDQTKKIKNKQNFNVQNFRYGVYGRLGVSGISLYYYYSITEMFDNKKGPEETRANVMMVGLALSGF